MKTSRCRWGWFAVACCVGIGVWCTWRSLTASNEHIELQTNWNGVGRGLPNAAVSSSALHGAPEDFKAAKLSSIASTIHSLLPHQFLPNFTNPCWYADYQITPEILNTFTKAGEDEAEKSHAAKSAVAEMYRSQQTGGKQLVCLPYVFVLGYPKCGSVKLCEILNAHPDFAVPRMKEIHWFTKYNFEEKFPSSTAVILRYFYNFLLAAEAIETDPSHKITGDCSPSHAFQLPFNMDITETPPNALPLLLKDLLPHAKYVIIVRHPIRRLISEFYYFATKRCKMPANANTLHNVVVNHINAYNKCTAEKGEGFYCLYRYMDWSERIEDSCFQLRLEATIYAYTLQQWRREIPAENLLILRTEDLEVDDIAVAKRLYTFLGLPLPEEKVYSKFHGLRTTQSFLQHPRDGNVAIRNITWTLLSDFFQPYNKRLADMLQDDAYLWTE